MKGFPEGPVSKNGAIRNRPLEWGILMDVENDPYNRGHLFKPMSQLFGLLLLLAGLYFLGHTNLNEEQGR
jgi:hypothetical protein